MPTFARTNCFRSLNLPLLTINLLMIILDSTSHQYQCAGDMVKRYLSNWMILCLASLIGRSHIIDSIKLVNGLNN